MPCPRELLETFPTTDLHVVTGGNAGQLGSQIGGLVDSFTGGNGQGAKLGGEIGNLVQGFLGGGSE